MAAFNYQAVNAKGKKLKGVLESDSAKQARQQLRDQGLLPIEVDQASEQSQSSASGFSFLSPSMSVADLSLITRQLATLVASGLPLEECLRALADQSEKKRIRSIIMAVRSKVLEGYGLAESLGSFKRAFPPLYRATVSAGEKSGNLDAVLERLADYVESQQETRSRITQAATYPAILLLVAIGVVVLLLVQVMPGLIDSMMASGQELPAPTLFLLGLSEGLQAWWWLILLCIAFLVLALRQWNQAEPRRAKTHALLLRLPLVGKILRGFNVGRYTSTLAILTRSGVPLVDAMQIAAQVVSVLPMSYALERAMKQVKEGGSLSLSLKESRFFPPMMVHMIASGEKSGELDQMLERSAAAQERTVKDLVTTIVTLFEPLILLILGSVVLFIVLSVVLPMTQNSTF